jgi:hypothetical protein
MKQKRPKVNKKISEGNIQDKNEYIKELEIWLELRFKNPMKFGKDGLGKNIIILIISPLFNYIWKSSKCEFSLLTCFGMIDPAKMKVLEMKRK